MGVPPMHMEETMGWSSILIVLGDPQQEHLIDPLKGTQCHTKYLNLGVEDNNHSSEPLKIHLMDICVCVCVFCLILTVVY
jgi:hypothetical protein